MIARLLDLRITADYRPIAFKETDHALRSLLREAGEFVERCRGIVADEVANGVDDPDPPADF